MARGVNYYIPDENAISWTKNMIIKLLYSSPYIRKLLSNSLLTISFNISLYQYPSGLVFYTE